MKSYQKTLEISVPFSFCDSCAYFEIKETLLIGNGERFSCIRTCEHSEFCRNVVNKYRRAMKAADEEASEDG